MPSLDRVEPFIKVSRTTCWWCQVRPADSGEHKFKRSDLTRVHGRGELRGPKTLVVHSGERSSEHRSTKSNALKFTKSMCTYCNNTRSQPFDQAYDKFIEWVVANEARVLAERRIMLTEVFDSASTEQAEDVLRYFVKHICCRLAESVMNVGETLLPPDALTFLDGGPPPTNMTTDMWIEPSWLRFQQAGAGDPEWISILGVEQVHPGPEMRLGSRWNYGWLVLGWECWGEGEGNVFIEDELSLPIVSTRPAAFELSFAPTTADRMDDGGVDPAWLERIRGGVPIDHAALARSPIAEKFIGGALDFEAGIREQSPDKREFFVAKPFASVEVEVMRSAWLCAMARFVWAEGSLDPSGVRNLPLTEHLLDPNLLFSEAMPLGNIGPESGWPGVARGFAAMASLKMVEAHENGVDTEPGEESLLASATLAGAAAAAAGAWLEDWPALWDSINSALSIIAPLEAEVAASVG